MVSVKEASIEASRASGVVSMEFHAFPHPWLSVSASACYSHPIDKLVIQW